ncbi:hypothetical protein A2982_03545 [candidate division WWE3 bacterium RIFCSPLOWO2_01_FULL_39_13]|uniref:Methyltransferase type 11 domain-containing protein n=1 Tax=candidate division WWE3 bacterium RIFCSPLOWO2_01_FULL_39_13 TaxID=1802624 RepID=A0A1F4V5T6_UNCKA|nr:MAG: hypothetical protein A2982_03545 [candidate division WWE3 bacterium RIFCSPLOWO2_01_FULL_39_13]
MKKVLPKVIKHGYVNIYSDLSYRELVQIRYKTLYKKDNSNWDDTMVYLSKEFRRLVSSGSVVLDAGCGNGNYVIDENRNKIKTAVGVDVKEEFTKKNISMDTIRYCDLEKMPFKDDYFDAVVSLWVLEHLKSPDKVFKEIYRVLKPNGYFFFATPNYYYFPLKLLHILRSEKIKKLLNKLLFGRSEEDVFKTYYKANTLKDIRKIAGGLLKEKKLFLNYDPSYTSFNDLSFKLSNKFDKLVNSYITKAHIIGIFLK